MVASLDSGEPYLRLASEVKCKLIPVGLEDGSKTSPSTESPLHLYEFFVSSESKTCPHPSVCNRPDGHVTGDLFEEVKPGCYVFRKRLSHATSGLALCRSHVIQQVEEATIGSGQVVTRRSATPSRLSGLSSYCVLLTKFHHPAFQSDRGERLEDMRRHRAQLRRRGASAHLPRIGRRTRTISRDVHARSGVGLQEHYR